MRTATEQRALDAARAYKVAFDTYHQHKHEALSPMYELCTAALAAMRAWVAEIDAKAAEGKAA